jgi:hypothetical protein
MDLKEKTFQLVTYDRAIYPYPTKRLNISGLLRLALIVTEAAKFKAGPDVRFSGV